MSLIENKSQKEKSTRKMNKKKKQHVPLSNFIISRIILMMTFKSAR